MAAPLSAARGALRSYLARPSLVLALAVPLVFLHRTYQPGVGVDVGRTTVDAYLSDVAILAVVATALVCCRRDVPRLAAARWIWLSAGAFLCWLVLSVGYGRLLEGPYPLAAHAVSAAKFVEYALLAPAAAVLLRTAEDVWMLLVGVATWSACMAGVAALQFLGVLNEFSGRRPGQREPAYLGIHDLAAFSGAALAVALVAIAWTTRHRRVASAAGIAGGVGMILAASIYAVAGLLAAGAAMGAVVARRTGLTARRGLALAAVCGIVTVGAFALRGAATDAFLRFLGIRPATPETTQNVQSWSQRLMLGYIGVQIFLDHPIVGVGFEGSQDEFAYAPHLAAAREQFPDQPAQAFPSPAHPWGVQNGPVQAAADLGIVGVLLLAAMIVAVLRAGVRAALRAPPEAAQLALVSVAWLLVALAVVSGVGLYAGIPVDALLWLAVGLTASLATRADERAR